MDKQKAIEEMGKIIFKTYGSLICQPCESFEECEAKGKPECNLCNGVAEELVNAGYGNIKQAVKEFCEKLKDNISLLRFCDVYTTEQEYYHNALSDVIYDIDTLFNKLYGEGKEKTV